jgi:hypothetical protein
MRKGKDGGSPGFCGETEAGGRRKGQKKGSSGFGLRGEVGAEKRFYEESLSSLNSCGWRLSAARRLDEVYELTLDAMERTLGFEHASFVTVEGDRLRFVSQRGHAARMNYELPLDGTKGGITVKAVQMRNSVLVADVAKDKAYHRGNPAVPPARSELAVPVIAEGEV